MEQLNIRKLAQLISCLLGFIYNAFDSFQNLQSHINANIRTKITKPQKQLRQGKELVKKKYEVQLYV